MTSPRILLVDDDPTSIQLLGRALMDLGEVVFATSGEEALRMTAESAPDVVLLDAEMPGLSGFQVCEQLKADPRWVDLPVIFVTSHHEAEFEVAGFDIGAADFIAKPVSPPLVRARVKTQLRLKRMADELRHLATVDGLTGIANRRNFDLTLGREWLRSRRSGEPLSLLMIDIDHFKDYNDHYGHLAGDTCLYTVAQALVRAAQRPADVVARYGGEEFAVLLPGAPRAGAEHMTHRILDAVEGLGVAHAASPTARHVTVSVGVSCFDAQSACWTVAPREPLCQPLDLVRAGDQALYLAKAAGRARARLLDIADADRPEAAREIARAARTARKEG